MRTLLLISCITLLMACGHKEGELRAKVKSDMQLELERAVTRKDFRMYVTSGRRMTVPGISDYEKTSLISLCGIKIMPGTGDVIKEDSQRERRKQKLDYMTIYNQKIKLACLSRN